MKTTFKAPQKSLKSSWVQIAFSKPKQLTVVKKSLGSRATAIVKDGGNFLTNSSFNHSNLY